MIDDVERDSSEEVESPLGMYIYVMCIIEIIHICLFQFHELYFLN